MPDETNAPDHPAVDRSGPRLTPIDDVLPGPDDPPLTLLICGINPGTLSARTNTHYAGPGNRFWPAIRTSGLAPDVTGPADQHLLATRGIGLTNLVARPSPRATDVTPEELREGANRLLALIAERRPTVTAVLGVTTYRIAFRAPKAQRGPQPDHPGLWVLDNPSGLNAHATPAKMAAALADVGRAAGVVH